jgi:type 1 glutamine amidotransferase
MANRSTLSFQPEHQMKILVLCDDFWHPARVPQAGLKPLEAEGYSFDWMTDATGWTERAMSQYAVVILTKSNNISSLNVEPWMNPEVEKAFVNYVRSGKGLLVIHSGSAGYQNTPELRALIGGVFLQHPPQCPVTIEPVTQNSLTNMVEGFTVQDEHYHMSLDARDADVFLTARSEHGTQPAGWTRRERLGRVCMLTPGHNVEVWLHPSYQQQIRNALVYCTGAGA